MTIYSGVLDRISGGEVISSDPRRVVYTENMGIVHEHRQGVDIQAGWIRREFVDIGGVRIKAVMLTRLHDALLEEAVGQHVALSLTGPPANKNKRHTVIAIWTPRAAVDRPSVSMLVLVALVWILKFFIAGAFIGVVLAVVLGLFFGLPGVVAGVVVGLLWGLWSFVLTFQMFQARNALK